MYKLPPCMACNALGLEFGSAVRLSKRPGSVWNCLCRHALKSSSGIIHKSRVSYPGPTFLSSATWPLLPKKHYNGLINQSICKFAGVSTGVTMTLMQNWRYIIPQQQGLVFLNMWYIKIKPTFENLPETFALFYLIHIQLQNMFVVSIAGF